LLKSEILSILVQRERWHCLLSLSYFSDIVAKLDRDGGRDTETGGGMPWGPRFKEVAQYQRFFRRGVASV
jgi:hypothetical protein